MAKSELFSTREGDFRILVEQTIQGRTVDWFLAERRHIQTPDRLVAHKAAVEMFVGREVEFVCDTDGGYVFEVKKVTETEKAAA